MINRNVITGQLELDRTERLTFGKHKGKLLTTLTITDPQYLQWLANTDGKFKLSDTWREYIEDLAYQASNVQYATYT